MKTITLVYNPTTNEYGINDNLRDYFDVRTHRIKGDQQLPERVKKYLISHELSKRRITVRVSERLRREGRDQLEVMVDAITEVNEKVEFC